MSEPRKPVDVGEMLLKIVERIGRKLRDSSHEPISYPEAVDLLGELEDELASLAVAIPKGLTLTPLGYLPARHPLRQAQSEVHHER